MRARRPIRRAVKLSTVFAVLGAAGTLFVLLVPPWHAPVQGHQLGYRADSMIQWDATVDPAIAINRQKPSDLSAEHFGVQQAALDDARPDTAAYQNIKVLTGISAGAFMKLHVALTNWVAPKEGCAFCHTGTNYAADDNPHKGAARLMIQMTRTINADWRNHVGDQGVTCYTCHRGQNIPAAVWNLQQEKLPPPFVAKQEPWRETATTVRDFFPVAGFAEYFLQSTPGHSQSYDALSRTGPANQVILKRLYEVMMQQSDGIGVNCGYCHNSRAFFDWDQSTPARWIGLYGIHMLRAINNDFLQKLHARMPQTLFVQGSGRTPITPLAELGWQDGNGFANCQTCHYKIPKPLQGLNLLAGYPALAGPASPVGGTP